MGQRGEDIPTRHDALHCAESALSGPRAEDDEALQRPFPPQALEIVAR
jgi:hypothetical protein